ncbi:hypothetical protein [Paraburkholderia diazotrophica]|uniref:Uncharacterized protein n=1 Tax=Paraburkholderia diazotrophica TaxID=667676 RepID=A0A1H7DZQ6_9BURK|nr:hypothetical protein [Paraburkholderia diazotrophica]SEK07249.1 hypothetical protein SAMN05192539_103822 [Paraburkholderia diazotrophica]
MLLVTVELLLFGDPNPKLRKLLGSVEIVNVGSDPRYGSYEVRLFNEAGKEFATGELADYPRFATTVFDLVARGVATALAGKEELPPRPVHPWSRLPNE